jgi:hypothetical protein
MEPKRSLPFLQEPTDPSPEPDESSPHSPSSFSNIHFDIIHPSMPRSSNHTTTMLQAFLFFPTRATRPFELILVDFTILIIFGEK